MKFTTSITHVKHDGNEEIRGHSLDHLIESQSFASAVFLLLTGNEPTEQQAKVLNAIFVSVLDHGPGTASALNARISASAKNPIHASLAAGILGLGERHGMAASAAMEFLYDAKDESDLDELVATLKEAKVRIPGYGHKVFTDFDPRTRTLFKIATDEGVYGEYCVLALGVHAAINRISSKKLPLNVDGAIAAILCDMGLSPKLGNALFLIGRVPGLLAQILEEQENDVGIRRLTDEEIEFQD